MNLGYACVNMTLSSLPKSKRVTTNRSMIKKTFQQKGIAYASELAVQNIKDLKSILQWNEERGIKFYRMSSDIFPWMSEYNFRDLPDFDEICYLLDCVGEYATLNGHRLTFHPGPFNVLGSPNEKVVTKTIKELNQHSEIMDLMGFIPSYYNKINIHVGGTYGGDFDGTAERWCNNFLKLDDGTRARLTLENDDKASMWSTKQIHEKIHSKIGIAQVHDIHHHKFCTGGLTDEEAMRLAASTWGDIKPVVHYSQDRSIEQNDPKIRSQAHSDHYWIPVDLHGLDVDCMLEAKAKEQALFGMRQLLVEQAA